MTVSTNVRGRKFPSLILTGRRSQRADGERMGPVDGAFGGRSPERHDSEVGYPTPEDAALAQWDRYPRAEVRVIRVRYVDQDHAIVVTDTAPSHPMNNQCKRTAEGWVYQGDYS